MSNSTTQNTAQSIESLVVAYYPFTLVVVGTLLNLFTFGILCRPAFRDTQRQPVIHYMRTIAIFDILMLYGWNLDHYLQIVHGFTLITHSIATCKIFGFLNYLAPQTSAWLRVFICFDRYLSASRLHRTWFSRSKHVLFIIACIITFFLLFNFHFFLFACYYRQNGTININAQLYSIYPLWDYINLGLYDCVPFLFMIGFNSGVIYHLIRHRNLRVIQNSQIQHRAISITLVITTFLFLLMTIPSTVTAAFFFTASNATLVKIFDSVLYTYHISSFPLYFIAFNTFRRECIRIITCKTQPQRVAPTLDTIAPRQH